MERGALQLPFQLPRYAAFATPCVPLSVYVHDICNVSCADGVVCIKAPYSAPQLFVLQLSMPVRCCGVLWGEVLRFAIIRYTNTHTVL